MYTKESEVYSFGILFWEVLTAKRPWEGQLDPAIMMAVFMKQERPPLPPEIESAPSGKLLKRCWAHDPSGRPTFAKIGIDQTAYLAFYNTVYYIGLSLFAVFAACGGILLGGGGEHAGGVGDTHPRTKMPATARSDGTCGQCRAPKRRCIWRPDRGSEWPVGGALLDARGLFPRDLALREQGERRRPHNRNASSSRNTRLYPFSALNAITRRGTTPRR